MATLKERLRHFEDHEKKAGDEYGAEVLYHARKRIAELETALATVGEVAAVAYTAQENGQDDVSVALAAIMDEVDTVMEEDDATQNR